MSENRKVWFITRSNSGFRRSLTEAVLAKRDQVVATTRYREQIENLVNQCSDSIKAEKINRVIDTALTTFGQIDVLV